MKEKGNAYKNTMSIQNTKIFSSSEILQHVYHADIQRVIIPELFFGCLCVQHLQLQTSSIMKRPARAEHAAATTRMAEVYGGGLLWCRSLYRIIPRRIRAPTNAICVELEKEEKKISLGSTIFVFFEWGGEVGVTPWCHEVADQRGMGAREQCPLALKK